ncbi:MAG: hypothetical protein JRJ00_08565 [Deltaproteobacteria bacterium]|nr:hypothetical protein [Deltaproteobacteria bacterium]
MIYCKIINRLTNNRENLKGNSSLSPSFLIGVALRVFTSSLMFFLCMCAGKDYLSNTCTSVEEIGKQVLEAIRQNDAERLEAMAITEEEYRRYIWPQSPVSKIKKWQEHYDFVWKQQHSRSSHSLRSMLTRYGGRKYKLVRVRFDDETTEHNIYKAHRDARLIVTKSDGKEVELNLFGSIVEMNGQFKIMSFDTH